MILSSDTFFHFYAIINKRGEFMNIKLIALDLDRTTLNNDANLTDVTIATLEKALDNNIEVVLSTGRCNDALPEDIQKIKHLQYALTSNGAQIRDLQKKSVLYNNCIDVEPLVKIDCVLRSLDALIEIFIDGHAFIERSKYDQIVNTPEDSFKKRYIKHSRRPVDNILNLLKKNNQKIENINLFFETLSQKESCFKTLNAISHITLTSSFDMNLEIGNQSTSKASALKVLGERLNIKAEEMMAFGDHLNDLEMLKYVKYPIAVANAHALVKKSAFYITDSNHENGVANAIEKFLF